MTVLISGVSEQKSSQSLTALSKSEPTKEEKRRQNTLAQKRYLLTVVEYEYDVHAYNAMNSHLCVFRKRGSPARILDCLAPWNLFARQLWLPVTAEVLVAKWQRHPRDNASLRFLQLIPGLDTLEDWLKLLAGDATRYWQVHARYYWTCWIFGADQRKTVGLKKRDSCWYIPTDSGKNKLAQNKAGN